MRSRSPDLFPSIFASSSAKGRGPSGGPRSPVTLPILRVPIGSRWSYSRTSSASHNVPLIGGQGQLPAGTAKVLKARPNQENPSITIDLSAAYGKPAQKVIRTVAMADQRTKITVTDQFTLATPAEILWGVTTDAEIEIRPGGTARLTRNGKQFAATILAPAGSAFMVASAAQQPPQMENKGIRRLQLKLAAPAGSSAIKIQFSPDP